MEPDPIQPHSPGRQSSRTRRVHPGSNPDDARYLAVVVVDGDGFAVPDARVLFAWFDAANGRTRIALERTDDEGVAVLADSEAFPSYAGTLDGYVWVESRIATNVVLRVTDASSPGTIIASGTDPDLEPLTLHVTDAGAPTKAILQLAVPVNGVPTVASFQFSDMGTIKLLASRGTYPFILSGFQGFHFVDTVGLDLHGSTEASIELGDRPTSTVDLAPTVAPDVTVTDIGTTAEALNGWDVRAFAMLDGTTFRMSPTVYQLSPGMRAVDAASDRWNLETRSNALDPAPAGTSETLSFGAPLSVAVDAASAVVQPEEAVFLSVELRDGFGNTLEDLLEADLDGVGTRDLVTVTVKDPSGIAVFTQVDDIWTASQVIFEVPFDAELGTYEAVATVETGPFGGTVTNSTTFEVVAEP